MKLWLSIFQNTYFEPRIPHDIKTLRIIDGVSKIFHEPEDRFHSILKMQKVNVHPQLINFGLTSIPDGNNQYRSTMNWLKLKFFCRYWAQNGAEVVHNRFHYPRTTQCTTSLLKTLALTVNWLAK